MDHGRDVWDSVVVGHPVRVFRRKDNWGVAVDGREFSADCVHPYQAWALGAAESYRLGAREPCNPLAADRDVFALRG
ncbi:MAG TPA: hypothetical protein VMS64_10060 [Candidatus Methylomirabilis sp.]|nr:hypothetical protein [Candidatus Methylomirabilis sp.]